MNNVIGYKGTPTERERQWRAMTLLRKVIDYDRSIGLEKSLDKNAKVYEYMFQDFIKKA